MSDSPFDELVERVKALTKLDGREAFKIADALLDQHTEDHVPTPVEIVDMATSLGFDVERKHDDVKADQAPVDVEPMPEVTLNAIEVLKEMYRSMPRTLAHQIPKIGRVPKESVFYDDEMQELIAHMPEHMKLLIGRINVLEGELSITLYDEANDLDRHIGPIDLDRFVMNTGEESWERLNRAVETLLKRLPLVLAADSN